MNLSLDSLGSLITILRNCKLYVTIDWKNKEVKSLRK